MRLLKYFTFTWILAACYVTAEEYSQVIYLVGTGSDFVRQACNVIVAETFKHDTDNFYEFGETSLQQCIVDNSESRNLFNYESVSYRISEIFSRDDKSALDQHTLQLDNDIQRTERAKFYILHDLSSGTDVFFNILECVTNFLNNVSLYKNSLSLILIDNNWVVYNKEEDVYPKFNQAHEIMVKRKSEFVTNIQTEFSDIKYSYKKESLLNILLKQDDNEMYQNIENLYIPTDNYFINWPKYYYKSPVSEFSDINCKEFGFLALSNEMSEIPRIVLHNSVRSLYNKVTLQINQEQVQLTDASLYIPKIANLSDTLEHMAWQANGIDDKMFCEILTNHVSDGDPNILYLCERSEFISKYIGLRSLKYEFSNYDLLSVYRKCSFDYKFDKEIESLIDNKGYQSKCSVMTDEIQSDDYIVNREYCYTNLNHHEEIHLLLKSDSTVWSKSIDEDSICTFTGSTINLNEITAEECSSSIVIAKVAVITKSEITLDNVFIISPMKISISSKYLPSFLLLETDLKIDIEYNVIAKGVPREILKQSLVEIFNEEQCYGLNYQMKMAELVSEKLIFNSESVVDLIEDYKYLFNYINKKNQLALHVYSNVLSKYFFSHAKNLDGDSRAVVLNILLAYNSLNLPLFNSLNLILDHSKYVSIVDDKIKKLQEIKHVQSEQTRLEMQVDKIEKNTKYFMENIIKKIRECKIISNNMVKTLRNVMNENTKALQGVLKEIQHVEYVQSDKITQLRNKRKELLSRMIFNTFTSVVQIAGAITTIFVPPVGALIVGGASIASALSDSNANIYNTNYTIPSGILHEFKEIQIVMTNSYDTELSSLKSAILNFKNDIERGPEYDEKMAFIEKIELEIASIENNKTSDLFSNILDIKDKFEQFTSTHINVSHRKKRDIKVDYDKIGEGISEAAVFLTYGINKNTELKSQMPKYAEIENAEKELKKVIAFKNRIFSKILPFIITFNKHMSGTASNFNSLSKPLLIEMKFFMKSKFKAFMYELKDMTQGFKSNKEIERISEELQDVLSTIFELNYEIQNYEHEHKQIDLLKNIVEPTIIPNQIKNQDFLYFIRETQNNAVSINIYYEVMKVINSFKQWMFPLAPHLASQINLLEHVNTFKTISNTKIDVFKRTFQNILDFITTYKSHFVSYIDVYIENVQYFSELNTGAFYYWDQSDSSDKINELLSEKEVLFASHIPDISISAEQYAIKFKTIALNLICTEPNICTDFNEDLNRFEIYMTHLGSSEYRCKDQTYVINTPVIPLHYAFEKVNGTSTIINQGYVKLTGGDVILSPYTLWKFLILPTYTDDKGLLEKYKDYINLELVGSGTYVKDKNHGDIVCPKSLPLYYKIKEN